MKHVNVLYISHTEKMVKEDKNKGASNYNEEKDKLCADQILSTYSTEMVSAVEPNFTDHKGSIVSEFPVPMAKHPLSVSFGLM